jgi:hypothetical protein
MELTPQAPLRTFATRVANFQRCSAPPGESTVSKNDVLKKQKQAPPDLQQPKLNQSNSHETSCDWQTYRTRFTVRARTLSAPLSFVDGLGREQSGKIGDYLVESNGVVTITPRRIFEDVYVALETQDLVATGSLSRPADRSSAAPPRKSPISTKKSGFFPASRRRSL